MNNQAPACRIGIENGKKPHEIRINNKYHEVENIRSVQTFQSQKIHQKIETQTQQTVYQFAINSTCNKSNRNKSNRDKSNRDKST